MGALGVGAIAVGVFLAYVGGTGQSLLDELRSVFTTGRTTGRQASRAFPEGHVFGPAAGFPSTSPATSTDGVELVTIGQGAHRLAPAAAAAFRAAEAIYGGTIPLTDSYRTRAQQVAARVRNGCPVPDGPNASPSRDCRVPTARPGTSYHERGQAVDVRNPTAGMRAALLATGWCQFDVRAEPWHFSFGGCG